MWSLAIALMLIACGVLARWSERRRLARVAELNRLVGPPPDEVDAAIDAHWHSLPASLKGDLK